MEDTHVQILLKIQSDISSTKALVETLAGPDGRIKALEKDQSRQWWVTVAVAPMLALGHGIARKLGVQI